MSEAAIIMLARVGLAGVVTILGVVAHFRSSDRTNDIWIPVFAIVVALVSCCVTGCTWPRQSPLQDRCGDACAARPAGAMEAVVTGANGERYRCACEAR